MLFILSLSVLFLFPFLASAQSVSSFTANPTFARYGQYVDFAWQLQDAGGYTFLVPCVEGIKVKPTNCGTAISTRVKINDYTALTFANFSGGTRNIAARIIPKDGAGVDYPAGARDISISVAAMDSPITKFTANATTTTSGKTVAISWSSQEIEGVNLSLECNDKIKVASPSYTNYYYMPCETLVFANKLGVSGSMTLNFTNSSYFEIPYRMTLLPAITSKTYDGTHAVPLTINIASDILPEPEVNYFTSTSTVAVSGVPVEVSWDVRNAVGVNMRISCGQNFIASSTSGALSCDSNAFAADLKPTDKKTIVFYNSNNFDYNVQVVLLPSKKVGQYDATRSKTLSFSVRPKTAQIPVASPIATVTASSSPATVSKTSASGKISFTATLSRGSRGNSVSLLQGFLKKDPLLYPEGLVSGFFGPATERAVQRFQIKYGIASRGGPGYGIVGPKTRAKLNSPQ